MAERPTTIRPVVPHPSVDERRAQGRAVRKELPTARPRRPSPPHPTATPSGSSPTRRPGGCRTWCHCVASACRCRRSRSSAAPPPSSPPTSRPRRAPVCGCSSAATPTWPTSAASPHPSARSSSTSTTSTRPCPGPSSGTSSAWPPASRSPAAPTASRPPPTARPCSCTLARSLRAGDGPLRRDGPPRPLVPAAQRRGDHRRPRLRRSTPEVLARVQRNMAKARNKDRMKALRRLTVVEDGEIRFASDPPVLQPISELMSADDRDQLIGLVRQAFQNYRRTLQPDRRQLLERYRFVDLARKVVGVGSVGTRCWVALLLGREDGDPLFLQVKEAEASVLEPYLGRSAYQHQGRRVVEGQRIGAGRQRHLPRVGAGRHARRRHPRPLLPPAVGLEGLGRHRRHEPRRARHLRPAVRGHPRPGPRPQRRRRRHRRPTSATATRWARR